MTSTEVRNRALFDALKRNGPSRESHHKHIRKNSIISVLFTFRNFTHHKDEPYDFMGMNASPTGCGSFFNSKKELGGDPAHLPPKPLQETIEQSK